MHPTTLHHPKQIIILAGAAVFVGSSIFINNGPANAKSFKPSDNGLAHCIVTDIKDDGIRMPGPNSCCWTEPANDQGDTIEFCIQCDSEWKNCDYTDTISAPRGGGLPKGGGTISEPHSKPEPRIKLNRPGNGPVLR